MNRYPETHRKTGYREVQGPRLGQIVNRQREICTIRRYNLLL